VKRRKKEKVEKKGNREPGKRGHEEDSTCVGPRGTRFRTGKRTKIPTSGAFLKKRKKSKWKGGEVTERKRKTGEGRVNNCKAD